METFFDVLQLLKKYGTIIYTGNRLGDIELMEEEIKELYERGLLSVEEYQMARLILKREINNLAMKKDHL